MKSDLYKEEKIRYMRNEPLVPIVTVVNGLTARNKIKVGLDHEAEADYTNRKEGVDIDIQRLLVFIEIIALLTLSLSLLREGEYNLSILGLGGVVLEVSRNFEALAIAMVQIQKRYEQNKTNDSKVHVVSVDELIHSLGLLHTIDRLNCMFRTN